MSELKFYNTLNRRHEIFEPIESGIVRMYTCGPTVYNFAHIGNFRAYMFEDLLRRHLKWSGYEVVQVMNLTDVDDKTIKGSQAEGVSLDDFTAKYILAFHDDLKLLGIEQAEHYPAATDHIAEMIELIERLFESGHAYSSDDGSVYFNVTAFEEYGKLANIDKSGMQAGARVDQDEYDKQNVADFALWKAWSEEDGDVVWDSPWGRGRPGWHLECSAMGMKYLGESFDIHTGGVDNMFPHHENEIAQSEAATGKQFVRYWLHCAHLMVDGQKMSKSLGNFYTLRDIMDKGYSGREIRYVLLSGHYRQMLNFTFDGLDSARTSLRRLDEFKDRLASVSSGKEGDLPGWAKDAAGSFRAALDDDLNMPAAMGALFDMVHSGNRAMDASEIDEGQAGAVVKLLEDLDNVLGYLQGEDQEKPDDAVDAMLEERAQARADKDWAKSDEIRDKLAEMGWEVKDTAEGQKLRKNN
ncbi:cysteine--tRNA ligase [bacterium E08(2017)]|nr:cysteine--tRNA ligase [bacterium E08(2017)]